MVLPTGYMGVEKFMAAHSGDYTPDARRAIGNIPITPENILGAETPGYYGWDHIYIDPTMPPEWRSDTLRHELNHYFDDIYGVGEYATLDAPSSSMMGYPNPREMGNLNWDSWTHGDSAGEWGRQGEFYAEAGLSPETIPASQRAYYPQFNRGRFGPEVSYDPVIQNWIDLRHNPQRMMFSQTIPDPLRDLYVALANDNGTGITRSLMQTIKHMGGRESFPEWWMWITPQGHEALRRDDLQSRRYGAPSGPQG